MAELSTNDGHFFLPDPARVIEINGNRFACGLMWQPIRSPTDAKSEIAEFAREEGKNLSTIYSGPGSIQAGYMRAESDRMRMFQGAYSLAAVLAGKLGESWIGVFGLDDGNYTLVAVHDGMIVPGCDEVGPIEDIEGSLRDIAFTYQWQAIYIADKRLRAVMRSVDGTRFNDTPLSDLLTEKKYDKTLRLTVIRMGVDRRVMVMGSLAALALLGYLGYQHYQSVQEAVAKQLDLQISKQKREAKRKEDRERVLALVAARTVLPPWISEPHAQELLEACRRTLPRISQSIGGWPLVSAQCDAQGFVAQYDRQGTLMRDFDLAAKQAQAQGAIESYIVAPNRGSVRVPLPADMNLAARGFEPIGRYEDWLLGWSSRFQSLNMDSSIKLVAQRPPQPVSHEATQILGVAGATPRAPWWNTYTWSYQATAIPAWDVLNGVGAQGFVIKSIDLTVMKTSEWRWSAQGEIHVKR